MLSTERLHFRYAASESGKQKHHCMQPEAACSGVFMCFGALPHGKVDAGRQMSGSTYTLCRICRRCGAGDCLRRIFSLFFCFFCVGFRLGVFRRSGAVTARTHLTEKAVDVLFDVLRQLGGFRGDFFGGFG